MTILAQRYPVYQPAMRIISSITNALPAVVTTTFAHDYVTGIIVRIIIPVGFGMQQVNQQTFPITVLTPTTFSIPVNTTTFDQFTPASTFPNDKQYATVVPVGENSGQLDAATQNVLPYRAT
jgi:hypothetical protein